MSHSTNEEIPTLCDYAARVLVHRLNRMLSQAEGVRQGEHSEPVHQMRVWSRRVRAAHELFGVCFSGKEYRLLGREVKAVTDALGAARDLDVMIETLQKKADALPNVQRGGVEAFIEHLKTQRKARQKAVEKAIDRLEKSRIQRRFTEMLAAHGIEVEPEPPVVEALERNGHG